MKVCCIENEGSGELSAVFFFFRDLQEIRVLLVLVDNIHLGYISFCVVVRSCIEI